MSDVPSDQDPIAPLRAALAGRYDIERELGKGAFATVYLAHDLRHDRSVAVKVLNVDPRSGIPEMRFLREIRLLARLQHPNILPLHDSGHVLDLLYYVMPYIEGESLRDRLGRERRLEIAAATCIGREVADALAYAHRAGIVHRDIKPENILLSGAHPIVADFGIARVVDGARIRQLTQTGFGSPGTPAYMSPEQMLGGTELDARSDIYSLGCVVYEMLGGQAPFAGPSGFARRFTEDPPSVRVLRRDVPSHIDEAIRRAMARLPGERYATADEFAQALAVERESAPAQAVRLAGGVVPRPAPEAPSSVEVASVEGEEGPWSTPVPATPAQPEPHLSGSRRPWWRPASPSTIRWRHTVIVLLAIVLLSGTMWVVGGEGAGDPPPRRVVVTPLANHTGSPRFDAVGLMVVDWVTAGLQGMPSLEVVPTPTALESYRAAVRSSGDPSHDPVRTVAAETGADFVVTGALYRSAERLLFRLQVTDARQRRIIETLQDIEAPANDPIAGVEAARSRLMGWFAGQEDERVRSELEEAVSPPTYEAYVAFSAGLDRYLDADFADALPHFLDAHAADSSFVSSLIYASLCLSNQGEYARSDSLLRVADRSRGSLGRYQRAWLDYRKAFLAGQHERALVAIRAAARLAPDSKASYNHAVAAYQTGRVVEALEVLEAIPHERGPMRGFLPYWDLLGAANHALGRFDEERAIGDSARRLYPDRLVAFMPIVRAFAALGHLDSLERVLSRAASFPTDPIGPDYGELLQEAAEELRAHGHRTTSIRILERAYAWHRSNVSEPARAPKQMRLAYALGWYDEADSLLTLSRRRDGDRPAHIGMLALVQARRGHRMQALALVDTLRSLRAPYQYGVVPLYEARIAAVLGDRDLAVARVHEAFSQGAPLDLWLHRDADLESLEGERQFDELVRVRE